MKRVLFFLILVLGFSVLANAAEAGSGIGGGLGIDLVVTNSDDTTQANNSTTTFTTTSQTKHSSSSTTKKNLATVVQNKTQEIKNENSERIPVLLTKKTDGDSALSFFLFVNIIFSIVLLFLLFRVRRKSLSSAK